MECHFFYSQERYKNKHWSEWTKDLSTINYDEEFKNATILSMNDVKRATQNGGYGEEDFYQIQNVQITHIEDFFKIVDQHKNKLDESIEKNKVMDHVTGLQRNILPTDTISYWLTITIQDIMTKQTIRLKGFQLCGESIFKTSAKELYSEYATWELQEQAEIIKEFTCNVLLTFASRNDSFYWTIQQINDVEEENEDEDIEQDYNYNN